jgi:hypothetical protein
MKKNHQDIIKENIGLDQCLKKYLLVSKLDIQY